MVTWYLRLWYVVMNTDPGEFSRRKVTVAKRLSKSCQIDDSVVSDSPNDENKSGNRQPMNE